MNTTPESIVVFDYRHNLGGNKFVRVHVRSVFIKDSPAAGGSTRKGHTDTVLREWKFLETNFKTRTTLAEISLASFFPEYLGTIRINPIDDVASAIKTEGGAVLPNAMPKPFVRYLRNAVVPVKFDYEQGHVLLAHIMHEPGELLTDTIKSMLGTPEKRKLAAMQLIHAVCGMHSRYGVPHGRVHINSILVQKIKETETLCLDMTDNGGNSANEYSVYMRPEFLLTIAKTTGTVYDKDMYLENHTRLRMMYPWTFDPSANTESMSDKHARSFRNDAFDTCLVIAAILSETTDKIADNSKSGYASAVAEALGIADTTWHVASTTTTTTNNEMAQNDAMNFGPDTNVAKQIKAALDSLGDATKNAMKKLMAFTRTGGSEMILVELATAFANEITQTEEIKKTLTASNVTFVVNTPRDALHTQNSDKAKDKTRDDLKTVRAVRTPDDYTNALATLVPK